MSTNFKVPPGLSSVDIIDFSLSRFVNFQSEITFPEEGGILQVANVGMHINVDGLPHHVHGLLSTHGLLHCIGRELRYAHQRRRDGAAGDEDRSR